MYFWTSSSTAPLLQLLVCHVNFTGYHRRCFISDDIIYDNEILLQYALAIYEHLQSNYKRKQKPNNAF